MSLFSFQNLVCAKNLVIDRSIQTAYIEAIRSAQHFIYIENQYFLGSSYAWPTYKNAGMNSSDKFFLQPHFWGYVNLLDISCGWLCWIGPIIFYLGADHLIPMELALKIASKIRARERFAVYIVIPMWPEGVSSSASVQEILFWQVRFTYPMMLTKTVGLLFRIVDGL